MRPHSSLLLPHLRRLRQWGHSQGILTGLRQRTPATWIAWTTLSLRSMTWSQDLEMAVKARTKDRTSVIRSASREVGIGGQNSANSTIRSRSDLSRFSRGTVGNQLPETHSRVKMFFDESEGKITQEVAGCTSCPLEGGLPAKRPVGILLLMQPDHEVVNAWRDSAPYWEKHREIIRQMFAPVTQALIENAQIGQGDAVLDIATGPGEPALDVAAVVGSAGRVVGADLVPEMVGAARRASERLALGNT